MATRSKGADDADSGKAKNLSIHAHGSSTGAPSSSKAKAALAAARRASLQGAPLPVRLFVWLKLSWLSYLSALNTHPVMTKSLTAAFISILSDLLAQFLGAPAGKPFLAGVDWISVRNQAVIGFFVRGLPVHYWSVIRREQETRARAMT